MNISPQELLKRYAAGERNFAGIDLSSAGSREGLENADLREINLRGADLYQVFLVGTHLSRASLHGVCLFGAHLSGANLSHADLRGADLRAALLNDVDLSYCHLEGANLTKAVLRNANLHYANLSQTNLAYTDLRRAKNADPLIIDGAFLWNTMMPDGRVEVGPTYSDYR